MRYIIGDIHGCSSELQALIDLILKSDLEADFYSVGDVVNKGPDSLSCLEILEKHQVTVIRGNHEDWLVRIWETFLAELEEFDISRQSCMSSQCGGLIAMFKIESLLFESSVMNDFNAQTSLCSKDLDYLRSFRGQLHYWIPKIKNWPYWVDLDEALIVHAGLIPGVDSLEQMPTRALTTIRTWDGDGQFVNRPDTDPAWFELVKWPKTVVFGHWAMNGLVDLPKFKGIDTGCVYGKHLTAWCVESGAFLQVPAQKVYYSVG